MPCFQKIWQFYTMALLKHITLAKIGWCKVEMGSKSFSILLNIGNILGCCFK